jgi:multidrug efflux pump subunit AcrA (membrane-fusion protein)
MRIIIGLFFFISTIFANVYYAKVEPYELRKISSNVSGEVLFTDDDMLGKKLSKKPYIIIDSQLDRDELKALETKLEFYKKTLHSNEVILKNLQKTLSLKRKNYDRVKSLKIKSQIEKDNEYYNLISSENSYINIQKETNNLRINIADLQLRKKQLLKSIKDKSLEAEGFVLYSIAVKPGQVVSFATPLATIADTSKALLTLYLDDEDLANLDKKTIYIDDKRTDYKIDRVVRIADTKNISKYKAQIIIKAPKVFSKLAKIELKEGIDEQ